MKNKIEIEVMPREHREIMALIRFQQARQKSEKSRDELEGLLDGAKEEEALPHDFYEKLLRDIMHDFGIPATSTSPHLAPFGLVKGKFGASLFQGSDMGRDEGTIKPG
jgi:hypothetical protein